MSHFGYRVAAMAATADGPQPVDVSAWAETLTELAAMLNATDVSALGVLLRDKDALRTALGNLTPEELGVVLGLAIARIDDLDGDTLLSDLLLKLAAKVAVLEQTEINELEDR